MYDKKISKIFEYISQLKQTMNFDDKLLTLANMAKDVLDADRCSIWSYSAEKGEFITKVAHGVNSLHIAQSDGIVGYCFLTKETMLFDDVYESEFFDSSLDKATGYRTKSMITVPIINIHGDAIGVFQALNKQTEKGKFSDEDQKLLNLVVAYIAEVLESSILYENLKKKNEYINKINQELEIKVHQRTSDLREEKQKAIEANRAKSEFLANMSHEIRTPLNAILGFVDILKTDIKEQRSLEYINIIDSSSKSLLQVINDILDLSKIESGKLEIEKINFDSKKEFEIIASLFDVKCTQKNINLIINIDPDLPPVINTDPLRIKQIIANLLSNAIKFTPNGNNIFIDITYDTSMLTVSVKDQGVGISNDKLDYIFEAFSQEKSSTSRNYGGTGLGLSISSELVKLLGGELKVKSEIDVGSEFYFSIPIIVGKVLKEKNKIGKSIDFSNTKLLLVEDNKANQMFMKVILQKMNIQFDIANDGEEAVSIFKNNSYDLILMDENMPNMNGIEAIKYILEYEKENDLVHTPIVALTANALIGDRERFLSSGMDEYLTKPVDKNKLSDLFQMMLT
ncbi:MAG: ATP-binding protein [Campylobacterota bacterium]|nr:ATP-binding protein [Campylobacterota bacterium]